MDIEGWGGESCPPRRLGWEGAILVEAGVHATWLSLSWSRAKAWTTVMFGGPCAGPALHPAQHKGPTGAGSCSEKAGESDSCWKGDCPAPGTSQQHP